MTTTTTTTTKLETTVKSTMESLPEGLRMERARARMSRKVLSDRSGVSEGTIARAEGDNPNVRIDLLLRILVGLGVRPSEFFRAFE